MDFRQGIISGIASVADGFNPRQPEHLFPIGVVASGLLLIALNSVYEFSAYQNLIASIGVIQAFITGYLSLKIYSTSRRDSYFPKFKLGVVSSKLSKIPVSKETRCETNVILKNESVGGAKIRDIRVSIEYTDETVGDPDDPKDEDLIKYKDSNGPPLTLDKNQEITMGFYIPDFLNFEQLTLNIDESKIGNQEYNISKFTLFTIAAERQTDILDDILDNDSSGQSEGELWIE